MRRLLAAFAFCVAFLVGWPAGAAPDEAADSHDEAEVLDVLLGKLLGMGEISAPELQHLVEEAGGIPFRSPVEVDFLTRDALKTYLREVIDAEYPASRADVDARTLIAFGLIEPGTDLRTLRLRLLEQNIAGFYDERPDRRRLYAVSADRRLTPSNQVILSHELRHALQDQYAHVYDILPQDVGDFDDRRLALVSLLEGDATLVMTQVLARRVRGGGDGEGEVADDGTASETAELPDFAVPTGAIPGAPDIVRDQMALPYSIGLTFARSLWRSGGWAAIKDAWLHPPESTEQILHPEEYRAHHRVPPVSIEYQPKGGRLLSHGILGEVYAHTLLGDDGPAAETLGWAGDGFDVWDISGRTLLVWRSRWKDEARAKAFKTALAERYGLSYGAASNQADWSVFRKGKWTLGVNVRAEEVWVVSSDDRDAATRALASVPKS